MNDKSVFLFKIIFYIKSSISKLSQFIVIDLLSVFRRHCRLLPMLPASPAVFYATRTRRSLFCLRAAKIHSFLRRVLSLNRLSFRNLRKRFCLIINRRLLQKRLSVHSCLRNNFLIRRVLRRLRDIRRFLLYRGGQLLLSAFQISSQPENT